MLRISPHSGPLRKRDLALVSFMSLLPRRLTETISWRNGISGFTVSEGSILMMKARALLSISHHQGPRGQEKDTPGLFLFSSFSFNSVQTPTSKRWHPLCGWIFSPQQILPGSARNPLSRHALLWCHSFFCIKTSHHGGGQTAYEIQEA